MKKTMTVFIHELKMVSRSKKNIIFIIGLVGLLLSYCLLVLPTRETSDSFDTEQIKQEIIDLEAIQEGKRERAGTGFSAMSGTAPYAENEYELKVKTRMVQAFEDQNFNRFVLLRMKGFGFNQTTDNRDWMLYQNARFPALDQARESNLRMLRYQGYIDADLPLTYEIIEQKTAVQTIQNFLMGTSAFLILLCAIYFSSDMISKDRNHRSLLQGSPIGWYPLINIKSLVSFLYTFIVLIALLILAVIILTILNGFGSFNLSVPVTMPNSDTDYFGYDFGEFDTMTMSEFFLLSLGMIPILIYLFIRLNALLSLMFKNSWLVIMISTAFLFSERIYYSRTLTELFGVEISKFPQTYFDFGRVISGEKYYLVHLESINYEQGIIVLLITILIIEVFLLIASRIMNKRRFYRGA